MDTPRAKARIAGIAIALAALALGAVLVLFVALGVAPALEQRAVERELARAEAEREAQEEEFMRDVWPRLGEADLPYADLTYGDLPHTVRAAGVPEHARQEEGNEQTDDSDSSGAPKAPGEKLGEDGSWTTCIRLYVKTSMGGPTGTGQVVRTDSWSRYRLWRLNPLAVQVELDHLAHDPQDRFNFFDKHGKTFVPVRGIEPSTIIVDGVETLHCDGRFSRPGETGDWRSCDALSIVTADGYEATGQGEHSSGRLRLLTNGAIEWVTLGAERRGGLATNVLAAQCEGQDLPGIPSAGPNTPRKNCSDPIYDPDTRSWEDLPPAIVAQTSDDCVGYCFRAFIDSVTKKPPRVVRVAIIQEDRSLARATLNRASRAEWSYLAMDEGRPLTFSCFEKSHGKGGVPHFGDCAQMESAPPDDWSCLTGSRGAEAR